MISKFQNPLALLGRILLSLMFITAGYGKLTHFDGTAGYIAAHGLPMPPLLTALTICVELLGGLAILLGFWTRYAAIVLAGFSILAGIFFHNYWALPADQVANMQIHFWKNVSIAGGFVSLAAFGAGAFSIDAKMAR
ncbi:MAG TPA: DoxX family protein [Burkholderiaceae bacterium]|jgi:putative oxidoreductase